MKGSEEERLKREYPVAMFFSTPGIEMEYAYWNCGEYLMSQDEELSHLIFVFDGAVNVSIYREDGSEFSFPPDENFVFGDIELITGHPSAFFAKAVTDITAGVVDIRKYGKMLLSDTDFLYHTLRRLASRLEMITLANVSSPSAEERLLLYIRNSADGRLEDVTAASSAIHTSRRHVQRILSTLVEDGRLIHESHGVYSLP